MPMQQMTAEHAHAWTCTTSIGPCVNACETFMYMHAPRHRVPLGCSAPAQPLQPPCNPADTRQETAELAVENADALDTVRCPQCPTLPRASCWSVLQHHDAWCVQEPMERTLSQSAGQLQARRRDYEVKFCCSNNRCVTAGWIWRQVSANVTWWTSSRLPPTAQFPPVGIASEVLHCRVTLFD